MAYKLALCSEVFSTPIDETIRTIAEIGFDGIEIAPFNVAASVDDVTPARRSEIRALAGSAGIQIVGLHWLLVSPPGLHLTTPNALVRRKTTDYLRSLVRFCADLGGEVLVLGSPKQRNIESGNDRESAFDRAAEGLRQVADECGDCGVKLLLEPLHPRETNFLETVEEALSLAKAIDHPAVGYILDCKAMTGMPGGILETIRRHGRQAGHFHSNDAEGLGPGMGKLDFTPVLAALRSSGYSGWVSTEPFNYEPDAETVAKRAIEALRAAQA